MTNSISPGSRPIDLLIVRRLPGRLNVEQAAALLGFAPHDIPVLVQAKLLKPLGKSKPNATKYFSSCELEELRLNHNWLDRATNAIGQHWNLQNARRRKQQNPASEISHEQGDS